MGLPEEVKIADDVLAPGTSVESPPITTIFEEGKVEVCEDE